MEGAKQIYNGIQKGNVFVHCHFGVSRSVTLVLGYLILYKGLSYEEAFKFVVSKRPQASPEKNFVSEFKKLEPGSLKI